jgi:type I restriction enzyme S subunit
MSEGWQKLPILELLDGQWPGEWGDEPKPGESATVVYRSTELDNSGHLNEDGGVYRGIPQTKLKAKQLKRDDLLLEASGGTPGRAVGRVGLYKAIGGESAMCANFLRVLRPKKSVSSAFLRWALVHLHDSPAIWRFQQQTTGMSNLKVRDYVRYLIDLPPLREQMTIATILDTLDGAIQQTEVLIAKMRQIKAGMMHDLFTRGILPNGELRPPRDEAPQLYKESPLGWIPEEWALERLGDLTPPASPICYGIVQPMSYFPGGVPVVAIKDLNTGYKEVHLCSPRIEGSYIRSRIRGGDVALSVKGSIGVADVIPSDFSGNLSRDVARIRPKDGLEPQYLRYMLESPLVQRILSGISVGTTRMELSIGRLKSLLVPIAKEPEQALIAASLSAAATLLAAAAREQDKSLQKKSGLMHDLLAGRVRIPESMLKRAAVTT